MRKLVVTRGCPGSGKSHALEKAGLKDWTLSSDALRTVMSSPVLAEDGRMMLDQNMNREVFDMMRKLMADRMDRGETLALDTTLYEPGSAAGIMAAARERRYRVALLDMSGVPLEDAVARNVPRDEARRVPEFRVRAMHAHILGNPLEDMEGVHVIPYAADGSHVTALSRWLEEPVRDLSGYAGIVHVGDVHGCWTALAGPGGPMAEGFRDDAFYVFVGDLVDRGIENGRLLRWFVDEALGRPNVALLWGNHEDHLARWAAGLPAVSREFEERTLPQLVEAGVTPAEAGAVCDAALDFLRYRYRGEEVIVTHGGLPTFPEKPWLLSTRQMVHGTGYYESPVDAQFERNSASGWQVHGHRNHGSVPVRASSRSFNLENGVEFGGNLRTCTLGPDGWTVAEYPNPVFMPLHERIALEGGRVSRNRRKALPEWTLRGEAAGSISEETLALMRVHKGVRERVSERFPHVASLNFTKAVFYDGSWDSVTVKARGMFFDVESRGIVARGYEKFFNVGERAGVMPEELEGSLAFPLTVYLKENGFLGNLGYDGRTDAMFVASKSTPDGAFADMFRRILDERVPVAVQDRLRRYLRDAGASMTFEVIDPVNDPHILEYPESGVVLLDVLRRTETFEKASYGTLTEIGEKFGLPVKERMATFRDWASFSGWMAQASSDPGRLLGGRQVEGVVVEDSNGFMFKVKLPYYAFWKSMRSQKERILLARTKGKPQEEVPGWRLPGGREPSEEEREIGDAFREWCFSQDDATLSMGIIDLRKAFGRDFGSVAVPSPARP